MLKIVSFRISFKIKARDYSSNIQLFYSIVTARVHCSNAVAK